MPIINRIVIRHIEVPILNKYHDFSAILTQYLKYCSNRAVLWQRGRHATFMAFVHTWINVIEAFLFNS